MAGGSTAAGVVDGGVVAEGVSEEDAGVSASGFSGVAGFSPFVSGFAAAGVVGAGVTAAGVDGSVAFGRSMVCGFLSSDSIDNDPAPNVVVSISSWAGK